MISMICSVGKNGELGKNNKLIWHIPRDMKFFKDTTMGHIVIMGRNTYESLPGKLPGRDMKIITSKKNNIEDVEVISNVLDVVDRYLDTEEEVFVIGGASIYEQFLKYTNKLYITEIDAVCSSADTFFPEFDKNEWIRKVIDSGEYEGIKFQMCVYEKNNIRRIKS